MRVLPAALALLLAGGVEAQVTPQTPVIRAIAFEGNDTTREAVMLREVVIKPGDVADPALIERSRQAIQDLGLFRSVSVRQEVSAGGATVIFTVEEKWYVMPIPRLDANSEGESAYGFSLRWYNVAGYNHTARANWVRRDEEEANRGESTSYGLGYSMPFVGDTPYGLGLSAGHSETPISDFGGYVETNESVGLNLSRSFAVGPASQGLSLNGGVAWSRHHNEGPPGTPEPSGEAYGLGLGLGYRDVRYNLYSEDGVSWGGGIGGASESLGSDYSSFSVGGNYSRYVIVGTTPHQNFNVHTAVGSAHGGPVTHDSRQGAHSLGGASVMRGYPADFVQGDFYWHTAFEYLHPIFEDWLRGLIVFEAGNAYEDLLNTNDRIYTSIGLGLRLRLTFLVNVEVEAGIAMPLEGGNERFFASKV